MNFQEYLNEQIIRFSKHVFVMSIKENNASLFPHQYDLFEAIDAKQYNLQKSSELLLGAVIHYFVIDVLVYLFEKHGYKVTEVAHLVDKYKIDNNIVFITEKNKRRIGYTFDYILYTEVNKLIVNNNLDDICTIELTKEKKDFHPYIVLHYGNNVYSKHISEIFKLFFPEIDYSIYLEMIKKAIAKAKKEIGLVIIHELSPKEMSLLKAYTHSTIIHKNDEIASYSVLSIGHKGKSFRNIVNRSRLLLSKTIFSRNYIEKGYFKAVIGTSNYAKSFLTSEYLYQSFNQNSVFDYTAIVAGYLKSVEQLLYSIVMLSLEDAEDSDVTIFSNNQRAPRKENKTKTHFLDRCLDQDKEVPFVKKNQQYFGTSMTNLINFLKYNPGKLHFTSDEDITTFCDCLICYATECRNEHFHKDNFSDWEKVEKIRNNTFLMYKLLLGGTVLTDSINKDYIVLEIENSFDDLADTINSLSSLIEYYIQFGDNVQCVLYKHDTDDDKALNNQNELVFITRESYERFMAVIFSEGIDKYDSSQLEYISISRKRMPDKIWFVDDGKKVVLWG